jgi:hypothetical protein
MSTTETGYAGARRAAAVIGIATCAETSYSTLAEEGAKVDLKVSIRHAFLPSTALTVHCQIKTGESYRVPVSDPTVITVAVDRDTLEALRLGTQPAMLAWVPAKQSSRVYWHIAVSGAALKTRVRIPNHCYVTPALRFELSRARAQLEPSAAHPRLDMHQGDAIVTTSRAKAAYKKLKSVENPLVGKLMITRLAWRHVTRRSKRAERRIASLQAVPYLKHFLSRRPDRYTLADQIFHRRGHRILERRTILMWYSGALRARGESRTLLVKIREDVTYPEDWMKYPLSIEDVQQQATLVSWWCKA